MNFFRASNKIAAEANRQVKKIKNSYEFESFDPKLFPIEVYKNKLEKIFTEGERFLTSPKIAMTEKNIVIFKLYTGLIAEVRSVIKKTQDEAITWKN